MFLYTTQQISEWKMGNFLLGSLAIYEMGHIRGIRAISQGFLR